MIQSVRVHLCSGYSDVPNSSWFQSWGVHWPSIHCLYTDRVTKATLQEAEVQEITEIGRSNICPKDELDQIGKGEGSAGDNDHHYIPGLPIEHPMTPGHLWHLWCRWENGPICELPTETKLAARASLYHRPEICYEFDTQKPRILL